MILFAPPEFEAMAAKLREGVPHLRPGCFRSGRFTNGELFLEIRIPVEGEDCAVLGSIAPPDGQLLSMLLLGDTLRRQGAKRLIALIPYLAYSRQDKIAPGQSLAAAWTGELLRASAFNRAIAIDVHSPDDRRFFPIPLVSLSPAATFASALGEYRLASATIVAPDRGAIVRCEAIRDAARATGCADSTFRKGTRGDRSPSPGIHR